MSNFITRQEVREQAGFKYNIVGESLGDGDGTTVIFYTEEKPITDTDKSETVDSDDVVVYFNGTAVTVSSVDSANGKITLASAPES